LIGPESPMPIRQRSFPDKCRIRIQIVEQHGRKSGYTLVRDKQIDSIITTAWPELPEWRC